MIFDGRRLAISPAYYTRASHFQAAPALPIVMPREIMNAMPGLYRREKPYFQESFNAYASLRYADNAFTAGVSALW